ATLIEGDGQVGLPLMWSRPNRDYGAATAPAPPNGGAVSASTSLLTRVINRAFSALRPGGSVPGSGICGLSPA
ncbi:MAG: hypothetical protein ACK5DO_27640, partial [Bradyrhizobium sp.]